MTGLKGCTLVIFLALASGVPAFIAGIPRATASQTEETYPEPEAAVWLKEHPEAFAAVPEGSSSREAVTKLVDKLYDNGVVYIGIILVMEDPAGLRLYMPLDVGRRQVLFDLMNKRLAVSGCSSEEDRGQDVVDLWF